jgi:hypothetical protein
VATNRNRKRKGRRHSGGSDLKLELDHAVFAMSVNFFIR